jgi:hypothetical protein
MATFTFSKKLAPFPVSKSLLVQFEDSLLGLISSNFYITREDINTQLTVLSQKYSEMTSGVRRYESPQLPGELEVARLFLQYEPLELVVLVEISPVRQGLVYLSCNTHSDPVGSGLMRLWTHIQSMIKVPGPPAKLAQPNTTQISSRIPSCRITVDQLRDLENVIDAALKDFIGNLHLIVKDRNIELVGSSGSRSVHSLAEAYENLEGVHKFELRVTRGSADRSATVTVTLSPKDSENELEVRLSAFDDPRSLDKASKILKDTINKVANGRTYHHFLYWDQPRGIFAWLAIMLVCMFLVTSDQVSATLLLLPLGLPLGVTAARRRYPYIVFEPLKLATFDQILAIVIPVVFSILISPYIIDWLAGSSSL